mgnify:CR=1 FL=1
MEKTFVIFSALLMFIGVGAGAFGAHGLSSYFEQYPNLKETYETAVRYHLIHGVALLGVAWAASQWPGGLTTWAGYLLLFGVGIFSGCLYLLVASRTSGLGAITPIGGVAFLAGWACLLLAAWRS